MSMGSHQSAVMQSDEWLTPPEILKAPGSFDLDPCASAARPWDTATRHFCKPMDGLAQAWAGRVWLNPPYSREAAKWLDKMAQHGHGTALVFARTETSWFWSHVWQRADAALFLRGRLHFYRSDGKRAKSNAGAPSVLIAYGRDDSIRLRDSGIPGQFVQWLPEVESA